MVLLAWIQFVPIRYVPGSSLRACVARMGTSSSSRAARPSRARRAGEGRTRIGLPLRYGRQTLGQVVLVLPEGKDRLEPHDLRTARWAARIMGRCLSYAARMRHEPRKNGLEDVSEALHKAPLTPRERDVVALLMSGASTRQIALETHLTVGTVHTYLKRIYPKLGVRSRVELVARMIGTDGLRQPRWGQAHRASQPHHALLHPGRHRTDSMN